MRLSEIEIQALLEAPPFQLPLVGGELFDFLAKNPVCGDEVSGQLRITNGVVTDIYVKATGCVISKVAVYIWLTQIHGQSVASVSERPVDEIFTVLGDIIPIRQGCARLGATCVQATLQKINSAISLR